MKTEKLTRNDSKRGKERVESRTSVTESKNENLSSAVLKTSSKFTIHKQIKYKT